MNSIFSAVGIKLYKIDHDRKHRLETLCNSLVASGFDDASEVKKQADEIKMFISSIALECEDVELELSEINQGSSSRCFEAKVDGLRQKIVKQFFPEDLFSAGQLEQVRLAHVPNGMFWWIKDDAYIGARNSFLKRFIRYICQSEEIKHAQATDEELGKAMLYEPELKFSSIGFIYDAPRFNGQTLAQEFARSDCDSVDEIKNRVKLIIKAAKNIKSYCHDAGMFHGDIKPQNIFNIN
ncbi:MAG: hypothetical protein K2O39_02015, partial [Clostridiales bacterium]|nr:hypothetical protein [Clostridiales bacterium]